VLCFYMGRPDLSLDLVQQVPFYYYFLKLLEGEFLLDLFAHACSARSAMYNVIGLDI
jgi:hypothetical protein